MSLKNSVWTVIREQRTTLYGLEPRTLQAIGSAFLDRAVDDLAFEWTEHNHTEFHFNDGQRDDTLELGRPTINIRIARAVADQPI